MRGPRGVVQMIDRSLCVAARGEECSRVCGQDREPVSEVGGVVLAGCLLEPELSAPERRTELGDEFFGAIAPISEPASEVAREA